MTFALKTLGTLIFVLASLVSALIWFSGADKPAMQAPPIDRASIETVTTVVATPLPAVAKMAPIPIDSQHLSRLLTEDLLDARDGRVFVEQALKRPAEGGIYYAQKVLNNCKREAALAGPGISNGEAVDARARGIILPTVQTELPGICRGFTYSELDAWNPEQFETQGVSEGDVLFAALAALRKARAMRSHGATAIALRRVLALRNPVLMQVDGLELLRQKTGVLWFESQSYNFDDETLLNAMHLVPCDFGLPCGATHRMVARQCRLTNRCYPSLEELIAREGSGTSNFARARQLRERVTQAVKRQDVGAFLPPLAEFEDVVLLDPVNV